MKKEQDAFKAETEASEQGTATMLKKYQATVLSMHKKLKELATKFEAGEKHKNHKLRKARK